MRNSLSFSKNAMCYYITGEAAVASYVRCEMHGVRVKRKNLLIGGKFVPLASFCTFRIPNPGGEDRNELNTAPPLCFSLSKIFHRKLFKTHLCARL